MRRRLTLLPTLAALLAALRPLAAPAPAQELPLPPHLGRGQPVWPAFEGWYDNGDGTYTIYFGYNNRNAEQALDIPLGERNFVEPAPFDGAQPTHFEPGRDWGVFGIRVPADRDPQDRIYWSLVLDGKTYRVPGHLRPEWKTDALGGGAGGNTPPVLELGSATGSGPLGVTAPERVSAKVGQPVELRVGGTDEAGSGPDLAAAFGGGGRGGAGPQVTVTWFKHQGPGEISFSQKSGRFPASGGEATTMATFSLPGDYVVRARASDGAMATSGHSQCCWTNGYVNVTVTR